MLITEPFVSAQGILINTNTNVLSHRASYVQGSLHPRIGRLALTGSRAQASYSICMPNNPSMQVSSPLR